MKRFFALIAAWLIAATTLMNSEPIREYTGSEPVEPVDQADPADTSDMSPALKDSGTTSADGTIIEVYCDDPRGGTAYLDAETPDVIGKGSNLKILYQGVTVPVIHSEMPDIYVTVNPGARRDCIRLIPLKANKKERQYEAFKPQGGSLGFLLMGAAVAAPGNGNLNTIPVEISHRGNDVYRLTPEKKLKKGHYAVTYIDDSDSDSPLAPVIYAFEVKK